MLLLFCAANMATSNDICVKATYEYSNFNGGRWKPIYYIVWPDNFKGKKHEVRVHVKYQEMTEDGH